MSSNPEYANINPGMIHAQRLTGAQDKHLSSLGMESFDARKMFLKGAYQKSYQPISTRIHTFPKSIRFELIKDCHFVNCIDLVFDNPCNTSINKWVHKIQVEAGDQVIDSFKSDDLYLQAQTNASIHKRQMRCINGKSFIPLCLAPFHNFNLVTVMADSHSIHIYLYLTEEGLTEPVDKWRLYGNKYYLDPNEYQTILKTPHEFVTIQNQDCGSYKMTTGVNVFSLNFNHPLYLIYLFGFDKRKVTKMKLEFDELTYYEGSIEPLEMFKFNNGINDEPLFIWFGDNIIEDMPKSTVNFSRIDKVMLTIETTEKEDRDVSIIALAVQPFRYTSGMFGLRYTK